MLNIKDIFLILELRESALSAIDKDFAAHSRYTTEQQQELLNTYVKPWREIRSQFEQAETIDEIVFPQLPAWYKQ